MILFLLFVEIYIYLFIYLSHKVWCYTRISGPEKTRNNTSEKISYLFTCVDIANQLLTRHTVRLMNERQSLHHSQYKLFVGVFSNYGGYNTKKFVSLADNEVQTFLEREETQHTKRKTESFVFSGFGVSISLVWEWKSTTERFATNRFWPFTWKTSSVGKGKVNEWEFCKLKITTIVQKKKKQCFCNHDSTHFSILRVSVNAFYGCYLRIVDSFIFIH